MHLRALVRTITGRVAHLRADLQADGIAVVPITHPTAVELIQQDGAAYLLRFDQKGDCVADTWHETIDAAKAQANFEFGIVDSDWKDAQSRLSSG